MTEDRQYNFIGKERLFFAWEDRAFFSSIGSFGKECVKSIQSRQINQISQLYCLLAMIRFATTVRFSFVGISADRNRQINLRDNFMEDNSLNAILIGEQSK